MISYITQKHACNDTDEKKQNYSKEGGKKETF